jgi:hypothetical protein
MRSPCCLCIRPLVFLMPEPVFMKLGMYIMPPEPISTAYFINPTHQPVYLYVYPRVSLLGNGSVNTFPRQPRIVGGVVFYAARVVSKESRPSVLNRTYCFFLHFLFIVFHAGSLRPRLSFSQHLSSPTSTFSPTLPLTEMSTRNLPGDKGRPARKADNLTAICEPTV